MDRDDRMIFPEALSARLVRTYGERAPMLMDRMRGRRNVTLRVNSCKTDAVHVQRELAARGIVTSAAEWYSDALICENCRDDHVYAFCFWRCPGSRAHGLGSCKSGLHFYILRLIQQHGL